MIKKLRKIYEALADEQSRDIFKHRLLYSTTDAKAHIRSMVAEEINRYGRDDAMFCLIEWVKNQNREIIVFGAGFAGGQIVETLTDFNVNVAYLADNNESLWAKERYGKKILNLDELASMKEAAIVIGVNNGAKLVHRQMMDMGIPRNQIYISQDPGGWERTCNILTHYCRILKKKYLWMPVHLTALIVSILQHGAKDIMKKFMRLNLMPIIVDG